MEAQKSIHVGMLNITAALIFISLTVYILIIGRSILLPLVVAIVIWYLLIRLVALFSKIPLTDVEIPLWISLILAVLVTGFIVHVFISLISHSIYGIIEQAPQYQAKVKALIAWVNKLLGANLQINKLFQNINFTSIFSNLAVTLTNVASNIGIIIVYVLFLVLEYKTFDSKIKVISGDDKKYATAREIIDHISFDINAYMKIKTGASLLTAVTSFIALYAFGISYAQFWAVLIFILNFIPTIGSIIAVAVTLLAVSIHFDSLSMFALLAVIMIGVQFIVGNILEPKWMGKNLNLSPIIILLSLAFWGSIWGIVGMFLCVPLMTMLNIILSKFESTCALAAIFAADPRMIKS